MVKTLYHGSAVVVRKPVFGFGKPYNDYGQGFYCSESLDLAKKGRDDEARRSYRDVRGVRERHGLYITRIMDEEMTADDLRL